MEATEKTFNTSETNDDLIEAFRVYRMDSKNIKESTLKQNNIPVLRRFGQLLEGKPIIEATDEDYRAFLRKWKNNAHTYNTAVNTINQFRKFMKLAYLGMKAMKTPEHEDLNLVKARSDADKILAAARTEQDKAIIIMMSYGGVAREDVSAMKRKYFTIHDDHVTLTYHRIKTNVKASVEFIEKSAFLATFLENGNYKDDDFLFISTTGPTKGHPLKPAGITKVVERLCRFSGVEWHCHLFRHLRATEMARAGDNVFDLDNMFGWKKSSIFERYRL